MLGFTLKPRLGNYRLRTLYYVEGAKETGLGGGSDENPHSSKTEFSGRLKMCIRLKWRHKTEKGLRAGDLLPYGSIARNGIWALNVSQRSNLAMTPRVEAHSCRLLCQESTDADEAIFPLGNRKPHENYW